MAKKRKITVRNADPGFNLRVPEFRRILEHYLFDLLRLEQVELAVVLLPEPEMSSLNWDFLQHQGATDVITFDYGSSRKDAAVHGDIFLCIPVALDYATQFKTTGESELVRYAVHGVLHLLGYDDKSPSNKRVMKKEENRYHAQLQQSFDFQKLGLKRA